MRDTLIHRGPDDHGLYVSDDQKSALGHRRLSLIDLGHRGNQPIHNEDKTVWITVNGEIYNFKIIREQLMSLGHFFYTTTDSEVIVHGYEEWGTDLFSRLKGMFALGIWDDRKKQLVLARDRFGIKPLYYYSDDERFIFASEIKGIIHNPGVQRTINFQSFSNYFTYRYVPSPDTIWENLHKLPPAHYLVFSNGTINIRKYWELPLGNKQDDKETAVYKVNQLLIRSVSEHLIADVLVGSFLSGGYDSSALVQYQSLLDYPVSTFSLGFEHWDKSEHYFARIVADQFHTDHHEEIISRDHFDQIDHLMYYYDEPIADISILPTFIVSKLASKNVKAVVSGEGADEIFAGYTWHQVNRKDLSLAERAYSVFQRIFLNISDYSVEKYADAMAMGLFNRSQLKKLIHPDLQKHIPDDPFWFYKMHFRENIDNVKRFQYLDILTFMAELVLTKVDRASMANSLEVRIPFLDHELVEYIFRLNQASYIHHDHKKFLLYENIKEHLPQIILNRRKQGFVGPDDYYRNFTWYKEIIFNGKLIRDQIISKDYCDQLFILNDQWRLWKIAIMELWYSKWI